MSLIVKFVGQSRDPGGLVDYLANNSGLHQNQHMVAGSVKYPGLMDKAMVQQVAADLRYNQQLTGKVIDKGHMMHITLSVDSSNGQLSDARWQGIANDFMQGMRFTGAGMSPVRWTAVNHGANGDGADHIHIAMSLVRENGKQVSMHRNFERASALATKLEQKYAVGVLQSRLALVGAGAVPYSHQEIREAQEQGRPEPARVTLERDIRAMALEARTEAGFVSLVRSSGILLIPFPRETGMVTGYSVALPVAEGHKPQFFAGGRLAKDLSLPQLRRRWPLNKAASQYAWRGKIDQEPEAETETVTAEQAAQALQTLGQTIADPTPGEFVEASHDLAGLLAIASRELEETPGELAAASRDVGSWAQPTTLPLDAPVLSRAGARLFVLSLDPSGERGKSVMFRQFAETMLELYRLHLATRQKAATKRQVSMVPDDANPAAEVQEDVTTLAATGSMLMVMNKAKQKRAAAEGATDVETPEGGAEVFGSRNKTPRAGDTDLIDRNFFRDANQMEKARLASIREQGRLRREGGRALDPSIARIEELSAQVGIPVDRDQLGPISAHRAQEMIDSLEFAAKDYGLPSIQTDNYERVASQVVGPNGVQNAAQADAFLLGLEAKAAQRQAAADLAAFEAQLAAARAGEAPWIDPDTMVDVDPADLPEMRAQLDYVTDCGPLLTDEQVVDLNRKMHQAGIHPVPAQAGPAWAQDPKDPRNWPDAGDPATPKQQFRLAEAGFRPEQITGLTKGEASVVVGEYLGPDKSLPPSPERARKAYDRVQSDAIAAASGLDGAKPVRVVDAPSAATTPTATATPKSKPKPIIRPTQ